MSAMLPLLLSSLLLVMAAGEGPRANFPGTDETAAITAYWQIVLPNSPMPSGMLDLLAAGNDGQDDKKKTSKASMSGLDTNINGQKGQNNRLFTYELDTNNDDQKNRFFTYGPEVNTDDQKNRFFTYGPEVNTDDQKNKFFTYGEDTNANHHKNKLFTYGRGTTKNDKAMNSMESASNVQGNDDNDNKKNTNIASMSGLDTNINGQKNKLFTYSLDTTNDDQKNRFFTYGPEVNTNDQKNKIFMYGPEVNKIFMYGQDTNTDNQKNKLFTYGRGTTKNDKPINSMKSASNVQGNDDHDDKKNTNKASMSELDTNINGQENRLFTYSLNREKNDQKNKIFTYSPKVNTDNRKNRFFTYGQEVNTNDQKNKLFTYGQDTNIDDRKNKLFTYGRGTTKNDKTINSMKSSSNVQEAGNDGERLHTHGDFTMAFFMEESLTAGSTVTPYIPSSSISGALLLRRDVAASIPMSMRSLTDILTMFAPVSHAMANAIWSALDVCENSHPIRGEKTTCATSLESMVEFAASVLTDGIKRDLQAFSSPDVPVEGVMSGRKYKVSAARRTTELSKSVTCHGMTFPFAVYMCHAVNPTRVYTVTLEKEELGRSGGPDRMEVLAVCHLDTSNFNPRKMPAHVKPGDAPLCHFIVRDSILWAPATPVVAAA